MTPVNIALNIYNIFLGIILIISIALRRNTITKQQNWIKWMVISNIILAVAHTCYLLFRTKTGTVYYIICSIAIFIMYLAVFAIIDITIIFIVLYLNQNRFKKVLTISLLAITIVFSFFLILTPFTGAYYVLHADNSKEYGPLIFIPYSLQALIYILMIIYLISNRKTLKAQRVATILSFVLFPQIYRQKLA